MRGFPLQFRLFGRWEVGWHTNCMECFAPDRRTECHLDLAQHFGTPCMHVDIRMVFVGPHTAAEEE